MDLTELDLIPGMDYIDCTGLFSTDIVAGNLKFDCFISVYTGLRRIHLTYTMHQLLALVTMKSLISRIIWGTDLQSDHNDSVASCSPVSWLLLLEKHRNTGEDDFDGGMSLKFNIIREVVLSSGLYLCIPCILVSWAYILISLRACIPCILIFPCMYLCILVLLSGVRR